MENNKENQGTAASKRDEKTIHPLNNSARDFVNQTGKSQNSGNDSDFLKDSNSKGKPENLSEGSEFLNDSIEQNNSSNEKEADTQDPRGKVKSTMIDEEDNEDSADLEELQVRRNT